MKDLGKILQDKREELGMDLDELQAKTKIRKRYLIALENGNWSDLPGDVYARGFVRTYAEALGLDGLALLQRFVDRRAEMDEPTPEQPGKQTSKPVAKESQPRVFSGNSSATKSTSFNAPAERKVAVQKTRSGNGTRGIGQIAAVVIVLAGLGGAWWMLKHPGAHNQTPVAGHAPSNITASTQNSISSSDGNQFTGINNVTSSSSNVSGSQTGNGTENAVGNSTSALQVVSQSVQNGVQTFVVSTQGPIQVQLNAVNGNCWVSVVGDGQALDKGDTILQGQTRNWSANSNVTIDVGNVPGAVLTVNGQTMPLPKVSGAMYVVIKKQ